MNFIEFILTAMGADLLALSRERDKREAEKQEEIDRMERELRALKKERSTGFGRLANDAHVAIHKPLDHRFPIKPRKRRW
jgi:hypothetical protein